MELTLLEYQNQLIMEYLTKGKNNILDQAIISLMIYEKGNNKAFNQLEFKAYINTFKAID